MSDENMKEYVATAPFSMAVLNNPALSMGITVKVGDHIKWDGYNVEFNHIRDAALLTPTINEGWLVLVGEEAPAQTPAPTPETASGKVAGEAFDDVAEIAISSSPNNGQVIISSDASSAERHLPAETVEGAAVKGSEFKDAAAHRNRATTVDSSRQHLTMMDGDEIDTVAPINQDREARATSGMGEGAIKLTDKVTQAKEASIISDGATSSAPDGEIISNSPRFAPAQAESTLLDGSSSFSETDIENKVYKKNASARGDKGVVMDEGAGEADEVVSLSRATPAKTGPAVLDTTSSASEKELMDQAYSKAKTGRTLEAKNTVQHIESDTPATTEPLNKEATVTEIDDGLEGVDINARAPQSSKKVFHSSIAKDQKESDKVAAKKAREDARAAAKQAPAPVQAPAPAPAPEATADIGAMVKKIQDLTEENAKLKEQVAAGNTVPEVPSATLEFAKKTKEVESIVSKLTYDGVAWSELKPAVRLEAVGKIDNTNVLEALRVYKRSHWKVRKAAKEALEAQQA